MLQCNTELSHNYGKQNVQFIDANFLYFFALNHSSPLDNVA